QGQRGEGRARGRADDARRRGHRLHRRPERLQDRVDRPERTARLEERGWVLGTGCWGSASGTSTLSLFLPTPNPQPLTPKEEHMLLKPAKDSVDIGIFVSDIKKSLAFYQGILGLEKIEELPTGFGTLNRLHFGTTDIKLMDPKKVPPAGAIGLEKQLGFRYITFIIRDLSGLCATL